MPRSGTWALVHISLVMITTCMTPRSRAGRRAANRDEPGTREGRPGLSG